MRTFRFLSMAIASVALLSSCNDDDDAAPVNEEEVITAITAVLVPAGGGATITLQSRDADGDGPNAPVVTISGALQSTRTYTGTLTLLNELASPVENITEEVLEEGADHQFFFQSTNNVVSSFSYSDQDVDGAPIGLQFQLSTGSATAGNLTVTLRHEPNKSGQNVATGDITNAGGETDLQVIFPVVVQ